MSQQQQPPVTTDQIRWWGAGVREQLAAVHFHHGREIGNKVAERFIYDISALTAEMSGLEQAADMCLRVSEKILSGSVPGDPSMPSAADMTPSPESEVVPFVRERIAEAEEWLSRNRDGERTAWHTGYLACLRDVERHVCGAVPQHG